MTRLLLVLAVAGCGPWMTSYTRGSPRRLDVVKTPSAPQLRWFARRGPDGVELIAKRERAVAVKRTLHYNTWRVDFTTTKNPVFELVEIAASLPLCVMMPAVFTQNQPFVGPDTEDRKAVLHNSQALAVLSPFQGGWLTMKIESRPSDEDVFADKPTTRDYTVRLPAPRLAVTFEALDDGGLVVERGEARTDDFGRVKVTIPDAAIALQLTAEGTTSVVAIEEAP